MRSISHLCGGLLPSFDLNDGAAIGREMELVITTGRCSTRGLSIASIKGLRFQSESDTLWLIGSCRSVGSLVSNTGHSRLPYDSISTPNDFKLWT